MRKICVITGTRAEYGIFKPLLKKIDKDSDFELQIIATGMHLSPEFGLTYTNIEDDGFKINKKIEIILSSDTPIGISKSMGLCMISFAEALAELNPDLVVVLGDRYEIFAASATAVNLKIPIVHLHGGEATFGALDEAYRHCITKMSYIHLTSAEEYRHRVIQLGEDPHRVFNVGALGIENVKNINYPTLEELENTINFNLGSKYFVIVFHPVTLENSSPAKQYKQLLDAVSQYSDYKLVLIKGNSDALGREINQVIDTYSKQDPERIISFTSLKVETYLALLRYSTALIGNSSSGIIEAPSLNIPTINIGDRQLGRVQSNTTINCGSCEAEIANALTTIQTEAFKQVLKNSKNPYGEGNTSDKIISILKELDAVDLKKNFYNIEFEV